MGCTRVTSFFICFENTFFFSPFDNIETFSNPTERGRESGRSARPRGGSFQNPTDTKERRDRPSPPGPPGSERRAPACRPRTARPRVGVLRAGVLVGRPLPDEEAPLHAQGPIPARIPAPVRVLLPVPVLILALIPSPVPTPPASAATSARPGSTLRPAHHPSCTLLIGHRARPSPREGR